MRNYLERLVILGVGMTVFLKQDITEVTAVSKLCVNFYLLLHLIRKKTQSCWWWGKLWCERANCKL